MEEIINSVMQSPENTNPNVLRGQLQKMGGSGGGGGVLMVTDINGTLDKTMGEIQDAYLVGKRVIINYGITVRDVIGIKPVVFGKGEYIGTVETYIIGPVSESVGSNPVVGSKLVLVPMEYYIFGETEEAARNAYPAHEE